MNLLTKNPGSTEIEKNQIKLLFEGCIFVYKAKFKNLKTSYYIKTLAQFLGTKSYHTS